MSMPAKVNGGGGGVIGTSHHDGPTNGDPLNEVKISPFEVVLATSGYDHTIKLWQAHTGQCLKSLQHNESQVNCLEISPDSGQYLAAGGYQRIRMFDVNNSTPVVNYEGVSKNVMDVGFQKEGKWMYTAGEDGTAKLWDIRMRNFQCQKIFNAKCPVNSVCLHPNQYEIFIGDSNGSIHIWNLKMNKADNINPEPGAIINHVAVNPQGTYLAAVNNKGYCWIWSLSVPKMTQILEPQPSPPLSHSSPTPPADNETIEDKKNIVAPPPPLKIKNPMIEMKKRSSHLAHKKYALKCKFSPCGDILVTSSADQTAKLWNAASDFSLLKELKVENQRWVWDIAFSADSQYLFTASSDNFARLWSLNDYKIVREYSGHQKALTCLAFRDGKAN